MFQNTLELLPGYLKEKLGDHMTTTASEGWMKLLNAINTISQAKIREMDAEQPQQSIDK